MMMVFMMILMTSMPFIHDDNDDFSDAQSIVSKQLTRGPLPACIDCKLIIHFASIGRRAIVMRTTFEMVSLRIANLRVAYIWQCVTRGQKVQSRREREILNCFLQIREEKEKCVFKCLLKSLP